MFKLKKVLKVSIVLLLFIKMNFLKKRRLAVRHRAEGELYLSSLQ